MRAALDPYRVLFPIGAAYAILGAALWPLNAVRWIPYPGTLHLALMIQGFEQSFVLGFLLTAMPAFTHGPRATPVEVAVAAALMTAFGAAALAGVAVAAQAAYLLSLLFVALTLTRRAFVAAEKPPEEFLFVAFGLLLGTLGGALLVLQALGAGPPLAFRFAERLLSLGMILSLVLGVGSLLVPAFAGIPEPLTIPGIAAPHERRGRRPFYLALILCFALAFVLELGGHPGVGGAVRAVTATVIGLWVWKLWRFPGRRALHAWLLWGAGWMILAGLWAAWGMPSHGVAAFHATFIGGFALLTLAIGTRVMVSHGRHGLALEARTLNGWVAAGIGLALTLRLAAEGDPTRASGWLAASALAWLAAWGWWCRRALPAVLASRPEGC